jgi:hypothetical protein
MTPDHRVIVTSLLVLAACRTEPVPGSRAVGTLIVDGPGSEDRAGRAVELGILRGDELLDDVVRELRARGESVSRDTIRRGLAVERRPDSRVIEVSVRLGDDALARTTCTVLLQRYLVRRHSGETDEARQVQAELDRLERELSVDGGADPARLARYEQLLARLRMLDLTARSARTDVRTLDDCRLENPQR